MITPFNHPAVNAIQDTLISCLPDEECQRIAIAVMIDYLNLDPDEVLAGVNHGYDKVVELKGDEFQKQTHCSKCGTTF